MTEIHLDNRTFEGQAFLLFRKLEEMSSVMPARDASDEVLRKFCQAGRLAELAMLRYQRRELARKRGQLPLFVPANRMPEGTDFVLPGDILNYGRGQRVKVLSVGPDDNAVFQRIGKDGNPLRTRWGVDVGWSAPYRGRGLESLIEPR